MKEVKLVAADLDHTLLTEKGELPPGFADYAARLKEKGIEFVIASGRPRFTLDRQFPEFKGELFFISDNGGLIRKGDEELYHSLIPVPEYQRLIRFTQANTKGVCVLCASDSVYVSKQYEPYAKTLEHFLTKLTFVEDMEQLSVKANKFTVFFPELDSKEHFERLYRPQFEQEFSVTVGDKMWIDMMNLGVNKGTAMKELGARLGIHTDEMMAFGDTYNDIEMLQTVKYSYLMANAAEDMQGYARYHAPSNEEYGVLRVLDELLAAK